MHESTDHGPLPRGADGEGARSRPDASGGPRGGRRIRVPARRDAVAGLGAVVADTGAEFVVVAGDVFEHNSLEPTTLGRALEALR